MTACEGTTPCWGLYLAQESRSWAQLSQVDTSMLSLLLSEQGKQLWVLWLSLRQKAPSKCYHPLLFSGLENKKRRPGWGRWSAVSAVRVEQKICGAPAGLSCTGSTLWKPRTRVAVAGLKKLHWYHHPSLEKALCEWTGPFGGYQKYPAWLLVTLQETRSQFQLR